MSLRSSIFSAMSPAARRATAALAMLVTLLCSAACERRPLVDPDTHKRVNVNVNISLIANVNYKIYNSKIPSQKIAPESMHVLFYDMETEEKVAETYISDVVKGTKADSDTSEFYHICGDVYIDPGHYKMLIYNFDTESTLLKNVDNYSSAEAYTDEVPTRISTRYKTKAGDDDIMIFEPDHLVVARSEDTYVPYGDYTIPAEAESIVDSYYLQIKVSGLEWVSYANAVLSGMYSSNKIGHNTRIDHPEASLFFTLEKSTDNQIHDDPTSPEEDVICTVFNTFGHIDDSASSLSVTFDVQTTYGTSVTRTFDISDLFKTKDAIENHWLLLDETITIDPPPNAGGGFAPEVDDWEDETHSVTI